MFKEFLWLAKYDPTLGKEILALRIMTGAFPSTPFNSLNHLTETPHIGWYIKGEAAKGAATLQGYKVWTV